MVEYSRWFHVFSGRCHVVWLIISQMTLHSATIKRLQVYSGGAYLTQAVILWLLKPPQNQALSLHPLDLHHMVYTLSLSIPWSARPSPSPAPPSLLRRVKKGEGSIGREGGNYGDRRGGLREKWRNGEGVDAVEWWREERGIRGGNSRCSLWEVSRGAAGVRGDRCGGSSGVETGRAQAEEEERMVVVVVIVGGKVKVE